ncbi:MAG: acyltransferase [Polyangiales bacterium]
MTNASANAAETGSGSAALTRGGLILPIDGLRAVAIFLVILYHVWRWRGGAPSVALATVAYNGWCGVDVFFAISGYLITGILLDLRDRPSRWRTFFVRRTLRIFPLYYATLAALLAGYAFARAAGVTLNDPAFTSMPRLWVNALYLSNFDMAIHGQGHVPLDIAWSLAVEEQYYLAYPWLVWWLGRERLSGALWAAVAVAYASRFGLTLATGSTSPAYGLPFCRMDALALGGLALLLLRYGDERTVARVSAAAPWLTLAVVAFFAVHTPPLVSATFKYGLVAAVTSAWIVRILSARGPVAARALSHPVAVRVGKLSYGIYLFHVFVRAVVDKGPLGRLLSGHASSFTLSVVRLAVVCAVTYLLAELSFRLFESPILKLKDRLAPSPR